ncbi:MAG: alpha/beta hydrolase, partial [Acidimicrobiales bacterium]
VFLGLVVPVCLAACSTGNSAIKDAQTGNGPATSSPGVHGSTPTTPTVPTSDSVPQKNPYVLPASLPTATPLSWSKCSSLASGAVTGVGQFQCATLRVPISYSDPTAGDLSIAVVRLPASGSGPEAGDIVMNPGGPGGSGVDFLEQSASGFPASLRSRFNLVSFDPRGVARSDPVTCVSAAQIRQFADIDPAPVTASQIDQVVSATKAFDEACAEHTSRLLLENMSTVDVAIDMDQLREALGQSKLTYLGFSYGTYLGAIYAQLFPTHIRAMVLDGALNPDLTNNELDLQQAEGFETDLHDFFNWCTTNSTCEQELPGGAEAAYEQLITSLKNGQTLPAELVPQFGGDQTVDYGIALTGILASLYSSSDWSELAQALQAAIGGDGSDLDAIALSYEGFQPNGSLENILESNAAVNCLDRPAPTSVPVYVQLAQQFAAKAPDFGPPEAWGSLECAYWPVAATGVPDEIHAAGAPPILVVGATHDPATPYIWAQELASQLDSGELLTRDGDGHTSYFSSTCIDNWVDQYLTTLAMPPKGTVCGSTN